MNAQENQDPSIFNYHKDHPATCLCCTKLSIDFGSHGWSEYTPRENGEGKCLNGVFKYGPSEPEPYEYIDLHRLHNEALHCKFFKPVD